MHTKLANPHFPPELQAQTALINFTVTPVGLEEQLLGQVVSRERPELEALKVNPEVVDESCTYKKKMYLCFLKSQGMRTKNKKSSLIYFVHKMELTTQQNNFKIELKRLEDDLLNRLSEAQGNFLGDISLVEQLENAKNTAAHIQLKVSSSNHLGFSQFSHCSQVHVFNF